MRRILLTALMVFFFPIISLAGWEHDENGAKYRNEDGTYKTGWHQDYDGKWYYLDNGTGYVLINTTTPDGYSVNENGVWIEDGGSKQDMNGYENKAEFEVTAYSNGPGRYKQFGYTLPVTVYYNNSYSCDGGRTIDIKNFGVSKDGALCVEYHMSEETYRYKLDSVIRYIAENGKYVDDETDLGGYCVSGKPTVSVPVMEYWKVKQEEQPVRAEVYIGASTIR